MQLWVSATPSHGGAHHSQLLWCSAGKRPLPPQCKEEVPSFLINAWYLDDGILCGSLGDLCATLSIVESEDPYCGLL